MKNYKLIVTTLMLATLSSCVNGDEYGVPNLTYECITIAKTKEVSDITNIATATAVPYTTSETVVDYIEAYVTSSDEGGNFYKSISMMSLDGLKGFSMPVDNYNLYTEFEPGRKVTIKLDKNRYFNKQHGSTVLGSSYNNGVGRISGVEYKDVILRSCTDVNENTIVKNLTIAQAKNDQYLNMLIEFDAVQFTDASLGKKYYDATLNSLGGATNHEISDQFGNKVILRVSEFATFAANAVPSKNGKIRGVMTKYNSDYQFMIRTINDVQLTADRMDIDLYPPLGGTGIVYDTTLNEPFTSYTTTNQQVFPKYINDAAVGSRYWQRKVFSGNTYIQMSSFGGTPEANRSLFIVPVNMTAASTLSFKTLSGYYNGAVLKVYYTTNYVPGTQITTATLVDITSSFTIPVGPANAYATAFTSSGTYNIPAGVTGNGFFVFEYVGNGSGGATTTMQIDDIVIN